MDEWKIAKYLIDAKKKIDTLCFIKDFQNRLCNFDLREKIECTCQQFYINCCVVLDKCFSSEKKKIITDPIIKRIYYERDKNAAHRDEEYQQQDFTTPDELIDIMKKQLEKVKELCAKNLPIKLTLDYVSHDKELFRYVYRITPDIEQDIFKAKYPQGIFHLYQLSSEGQHYLRRFSTEEEDKRNAEVFGYNYDKAIEQAVLGMVNNIHEVSEKEKIRQMNIIKNGLNSKERLQNRQDCCIKYNILYNQSVWERANESSLRRIEKLQGLGFLDEFELVNWESMNDEVNRRKILMIMEEANE